jgi:hypothetical protein
MPSDLVDYGIFEENSYIRAHVGPIAKTVFVFKTADMIKHIQNSTYPIKPAKQHGVDQITAHGRVVPCNLNFIRSVSWDAFPWWESFDKDASTTRKGKLATRLVLRLMRLGLFPLWVIPEEVTDIKLDILGTDILISGVWKIQVKCDFTAGPKENIGCSGNLYIQTAEINPLKYY